MKPTHPTPFLVLLAAGLPAILSAFLLHAQENGANPDPSPTPAIITQLDGDLQMDAPKAFLLAPLEVMVTDVDGHPLANYPVHFQVLSGEGTLNGNGPEDDGTSAPALTTYTGASGWAATYLQLGDTPPGTLHLVQASVTGGSVAFHCYTDGVISVVAGNNQVGDSGVWAATPLRIRMLDAQGNPMPAGLPVYFWPYAGGGEVGPVPTGNGQAIWPVYTATDADGCAQMFLKPAGAAFADNAVWVTSGTPDGIGFSLHGYVAGTITVSSGDKQSGTPRAWLPLALQVKLVDPAGQPVVGQQVCFTPLDGSGTLADKPGGAGSSHGIFAATDVGGLAVAYFKPAGSFAAKDAVRATVYSAAPYHYAEPLFSVDFSVTAAAVDDVNDNGIPDAWEIRYFGGPNAPGGGAGDDPDHDGRSNLEEYRQGSDPTDYYNGTQPVLTVVGGDQQSAPAGMFNPGPFEILVRSAAGTVLANAPVNFTVTQGEGKVASASDGSSAPTSTLTVLTDGSGIARACYRQPDEFGPAGVVSVGARNAQVSIATSTADPRTLAAIYRTDFESAEGYAAGPLDGQGGWMTGFGTAEITGEDHISGAFAARLKPSYSDQPFVEHDFDTDPSRPVVFVDFYGKLVADADPAAAGSFGTDSAWVDLQELDGRGEIFVFDGDWGSGGWVDTGASVPLDGNRAMARWTRFTLRMNYARRTWDLYVDGRMVVAELTFNDPTTDRLFGFWFCGHSSQPSSLDFFYAGYDNPLFADADRDGMDDAWEIQHGLDPGLDDQNRDLDGDGLDNVQEYVLGTDPQNADSDGDGLPDGWEVAHGFNPLAAADGMAESAGDGLPDWWKLAYFGTTDVDPDLDPDGDGLTNLQEYQLGTDPTTFTSEKLKFCSFPDAFLTV